ncbi:recombinase family protein [Planomicrobium sp. Y74]|uniref:recombinase family protein n=1 Tax=Planomicrobium sp. Y74 TaxID=2478977 RepID=UPI000EF51A49|nr:recombinase family protein [Planomicrobium sp. Y74]RLQ90282.1 recombinase family protein [Planomicrobium sp. Y74]
MQIGYARPIEGDINCDKQKELFIDLNCDEAYIESHSSPKKREELKSALALLAPGDRLIVKSLHALADSTRHLVELLDALEQKGCTLYSHREQIDTAPGNLFTFQKIVQCLADFQSDSISAKTKAGLTVAKEKGMHAGRPRKPDANVKKAIKMYESKKYNLAEIKEQTGISKSTLYRYLEN